MAERLVHTVLDLPPGRWQLLWYGRVSPATVPEHQRGFTAFFLGRSPSLSQEPYLKRNVRASDFYAWPIGTSFEDGRVVPLESFHLLPRFETRTVKLCFDQQNIRLHPRARVAAGASDFLQALAQEPLFERLPHRVDNDPDYNSTTIEFVREQVWIPAAELLRSLYGCNSKFTTVYFNGKMQQPSRFIFNPYKSGLDPTSRKATVWLRQWVDDRCAAFVAHLAMSPHALAAAIRVAKSIQLAVYLNDGLFEVGPHFEGTWSCEVDAYDRLRSDKRVTLVSRIRSVNWHTVFTSVAFDRDNDARKVFDKAANLKKMRRERAGIVPVAANADVPSSEREATGTNVSAGPTLGPPKTVYRDDQRGSELAWIDALQSRATKLPQRRNTHESAGKRRVERDTDGHLSTGEPSSKKGELVGDLLRTSTPIGDDTPQRLIEFAYAVAALRSLPGVCVEFLSPTPRCREFAAGVKLFQLTALAPPSTQVRPRQDLAGQQPLPSTEGRCPLQRLSWIGKSAKCQHGSNGHSP
jgi:hypothetical protein